MEPIIKSKYATDGYKLSMGNISWWMNMIQGKNIQGRFAFVDRDNYYFTPHFVDELRDQINSMEALDANPEIAHYTSQKWKFLNQEFLRWYDQVFFHDPSMMDISQKDGKMRLIFEGPMHTSTHFEIPSLRCISTLKTKYSGRVPINDWQQAAYQRAMILQEKGVLYSEFGGRRPDSPKTHYESLAQYNKFRKEDGKGGLIGTSWVEYAYQFNLMIMGTMAHEYIEMMAAIYGYENANRMAMQTWVDYYGKCLGYYLPDTYTTEDALRVFNYKYAHIFNGLRHDSGDPKQFLEKIAGHYKSLDIDPLTKWIIFSNSLKNLDEIIELNEYRRDLINRSFGLGGFIANNVGYGPYNMVIKLVAVKIGNGEWIDVVKLSDDIGKTVGKPEEAIKCRRILRI